MRYNRPPPNGFTLIELMVTLAVMAIVLGISAPNIQQFIRDSRITTQTNELVGLLNLARSQAIHEGHRSEICTSSDQQQCGNGGWADGWLVWVDRNDNNSLDADEVARIGGAISIQTATQSRNSANAGFTSISFTPTGFATLGSGIAFATITLLPLDCSGQQGRRITVNASGSLKTVHTGCTG